MYVQGVLFWLRGKGLRTEQPYGRWFASNTMTEPTEK